MSMSPLIEGNVWRRLLLFALPIMGANFLQALYGTVDLMIVGLFSNPAEVSAVSTGSMTMQTITGIMTGLSVGSTVCLGQAIGGRDYHTASGTLASALSLFSLIGILFSFTAALFSAPLASLMNAPDAAFYSTTAYNRICGAGLIFMVLFNAFSSIFRALGDSRTPLVMMIIACSCNILGDLLLVGHFRLGAAGAAAATVAAQALSVAVIFLVIRRKGFGFPLIRTSFRPQLSESFRILRYGTPIAAQDALTGISFMVILAILNTFGVIASAGVGIAEKICGLIFIIPGAMMSAISAFSAQNYGAGQFVRAREGLRISIIASELMGLLMFLLCFFNGNLLARLFTEDAAVCAAAADYLRSYAVDCLLVGINFSLMGYLSGIGHTGFVAVQGILSAFFVRIPVMWLMSRIPGVTLFQIGFSIPLATVFAIILTLLYIRVRKPAGFDKAELG